MSRKPKIRRATFCGFTGEGETMREARKELGFQLEAAIKGSFEPWYFYDRQTLLIVSRDLSGWGYSIAPLRSDPCGFMPDRNVCNEHDFADTRENGAMQFARENYSRYEAIPPALLSVIGAEGRSELQSHFSGGRTTASMEVTVLGDLCEHRLPRTGELKCLRCLERYDPMTRAQLISECEKLRAENQSLRGLRD